MKTFYLQNHKVFLRYIDTGKDRQSLVFIHGLGSSSVADFSDILFDSKFSGYRIILVELLGHGFSDKPENFGYGLYNHAEVIASLLDHLQLKKCIVVGHSLGGTIAIALTQKRADLVSRLIVAEPNLDPGIGTGSKIITAQEEEEFIRKGYEKYLESLSCGGNRTNSESIYYASFSLASPLAIHRSAVRLLKGTEPDQRTVLKSLSIPRSYILGEKNINDIPETELLELGFNLFVVPNSGHAMMNDNPVKFSKILFDAISY